MQKHTKLEAGDHAGGGRRRTSASPAPPVMQRISHVHLICRGVAAAHLPRIVKGDARSHLRRALPPRTPSRVCASHVHRIRRGDFGHALRVRRAPFRRCPPQNGDEKLRPASNRCWAEFCDSSRAGAAAFLWAFRRPFRWLSCAAAFLPAFLCGGLFAAVPPAATVQPFSRGLRGLARAPRLEPGAHMVVQAAERLHHRPRQQAEHDEDERALQIELL